MNDTLTIKLAKPLEWVRVEENTDFNGLEDLRAYVIRKDGREWEAYLDFDRGLEGLECFKTRALGERGPSGHFPFEVALIETPPWPIVHKDADGWIDLEKTPVELLEKDYHYELRGRWDGSAWAYAGRESDRGLQWVASGFGCFKALPQPYNNPTSVRRCAQEDVPEDWLYGPPKQPEPETMEQRVARLEAQMKEVSKASGKGGGE